MKILKISAISIAVIIILLFIFLAYLGMFASYQVVEKPTGPYLIAYESFTGPYYETGKVFDRVYTSLKEDGISTERGIGLYYDDPAQTPAEELRSDCGVIIEDKDLEAFNKVKADYQTMAVPQAERLVVEFPKKNAFSYMIGPMKVYPIIAEYMEKRGYQPGTAGIEIYDEPNKRILFIMNIKK